MHNILVMIKKEFRQIFRSKPMLMIIFAMPLIQLLILSNAADFEIKKLRLAVEDHDHSKKSKDLINDLAANDWFELKPYSLDRKFHDQLLAQNKIEAVLTIPENWEKDVYRNLPTSIQIRLDAIDGATAEVAASYISQEFNNWSQNDQKLLRTRYLFNAELNYRNFMVPGILVMLVTVIGIILTALNIVREKEIGTLEQINVTPLKKQQYIIGKLVPMLIIGIVEFTMGLLAAVFIFHVPIVGSVFMLYFYLLFYLIVMCGIGLFLSTIAANQQQAIFMAFFVMMIFLFLSGLFSPIDSMPSWAKILTKFVPLSYFVRVMRSIMLKGSGLAELKMELVVLIVMGIVTQVTAIINYRKR